VSKSSPSSSLRQAIPLEMAPVVAKAKAGKHKPHHKRKNRRVRNRGGKVRPVAPDAAQNQPLSEVLNETKPKHRKAQPWTAIVPVSDDPLEQVCPISVESRIIQLTHPTQNIVQHVPMPEGYIFVPKGDVYITRHCRSKTKESNQIVYLVYVRSSKYPWNIPSN
jgi:hypothetical protein